MKPCYGCGRKVALRGDPGWCSTCAPVPMPTEADVDRVCDLLNKIATDEGFPAPFAKLPVSKQYTIEDYPGAADAAATAKRVAKLARFQACPMDFSVWNATATLPGSIHNLSISGKVTK